MTQTRIKMYLKLLYLFSVTLFGKLRNICGAETFRLTEIFRDDFNTDDFLNTSKWNVAHRHTASVLELSYYLKENVRVVNEYLIMLCEKEDYAGCSYTSARVDSNAKFQFLYGEVEWRAKLPRGLEFYSGLWLTKPTNKSITPLPLEFSPPAVAFIDHQAMVSERLFYGRNHLQQVAYEAGLYSNNYLSKKPLAFHTYRLVWTKENLEFFVDDHHAFRSTDPEKIPQVPLEIVMNIVVGGVFCDVQANSTTKFESRQVLIDYVVVRQNRSYFDNATAEALGSEVVPAYFQPVVGILSTLLVVCIIAVVGFAIVHSRKRYRIEPSRF